MENSLGFFITPPAILCTQNQVKLIQLQKTKKWLLTRYLDETYVIDEQHSTVLNKKEDLLIISRKKIYFLEKQLDWNVAFVINSGNEIYNLSLYDQKLIFQSASKVFIIQKNQNKWTFLQRIDFQETIEQAFFVSNEMFIIYPKLSKQFEIYKLSETKKDFIKTEQIQVHGKTNGNIQFCYIQSKNMLLAIKGRFINTFEITENDHIILKEIFFWDRNKLEYKNHSENFFIAQFASQKRGVAINKIKIFD